MKLKATKTKKVKTAEQETHTCWQSGSLLDMLVALPFPAIQVDIE